MPDCSDRAPPTETVQLQHAAEIGAKGALLCAGCSTPMCKPTHMALIIKQRSGIKTNVMCNCAQEKQKAWHVVHLLRTQQKALIIKQCTTSV